MNIQKQTDYCVRNLYMGRLVSSLLACFALVLFLVPAYANVGATSLTWEEYAKEVRMLEESIGFYEDWPIAQKEKLIRALVDMGHIRESSATAQFLEASMSEENRHALADQIMLRFLGGDSNPFVSKDGVRAIRWESLTNVILGKPSTWTLKERVWYQQMTNMFGREDPDTLVLPNEDDLPEKEAVAIAREAIINAYDLAEDALDRFMPDANLYVTNSELFDEGPRPNYRRWNVSFLYYEYGTDGPTILHNYLATVDENGHVIGDTEIGMPHVQEWALEEKTKPDDATPVIVRRFHEYAESERCYFPWQWPMDTRAEYSNEIRPQVLAALERKEPNALANPSFSEKPIQEIVDSTTFAYGLPEEKHIQESEAYRIAQRALAERYGFSDADIERYIVYPSFDVTDPNRHLWKFLFSPKSFEDMETVLLYKIELEADTGSIAATHVIDWDRLFEDSAYDLLLY